MGEVEVKILTKDEPGPLFPGLLPGEVVRGVLECVGYVEGEIDPVVLRIKLSDGRTSIVRVETEQFRKAARVVMREANTRSERPSSVDS